MIGSLARHQLETQHQVMQQDKVKAKTADEMLTAVSREHEFYKSLDGSLNMQRSMIIVYYLRSQMLKDYRAR
ncbi:hypothetical protein A3305_07605 (plasmid) [Rickettsia amblyommatis]|uniref:hypothetical protein n=2 Tax=Rickettsia amblyommatis TaxID=33989 RepID=UPI0005A4767B|nr:hypothetical protein [Rickettsia amblyommatis]ARD88220.1 hypothetical protein A3305_07605 [Rickettsia amblyommatis]